MRGWLQIVIVSNEEERREFIKDVGEDVLPEEYGGRARLIALQDAVLPSLHSATDWFQGDWLAWQ